MSEIVKTQPANKGFLISADDIDIPRINLIQKTSNIDAPVGSIVLDKIHVLAEKESAIPVTVINPIKGWKEDIAYGSDGVCRMAYTEADAATLREESDHKVIEFAEITLLFQSPDEDPDPATYPLPLGGKFCALGKIHVHKDAYRMTYKALATWAAANSPRSISEVEWEFKSSLLQRGPHSWFSPSLKVTSRETNPQILEFLNKFSA